MFLKGEGTSGVAEVEPLDIFKAEIDKYLQKSGYESYGKVAQKRLREGQP